MFLQRAIAEGADFIKSDITATKDGKLIYFHDLILNEVTHVQSHFALVGRIWTKQVEGEIVTEYFSGDLLWSSRMVKKCIHDFVVQNVAIVEKTT